MKTILGRDPTLLIAALGAWAVLTGVALLWPGSAFASAPSWGLLRRLPIPEEAWGAGMVADGLLLILTTFRGRIRLRCGAAFLSVPLWLGFGLLSVIGGAEFGTSGGYPYGIFSGTGLWWVAGGLFLVISGIAWIDHAEPPRPHLAFIENWHDH